MGFSFGLHENKRQTDGQASRHKKKQNAVLSLSMIITFFHIFYCSFINNFTYLSKMVQLLTPHQEINAYSAHFQSCLRFIGDIPHRKREGDMLLQTWCSCYGSRKSVQWLKIFQEAQLGEFTYKRHGTAGLKMDRKTSPQRKSLTIVCTNGPDLLNQLT